MSFVSVLFFFFFWGGGGGGGGGGEGGHTVLGTLGSQDGEVSFGRGDVLKSLTGRVYGTLCGCGSKLKSRGYAGFGLVSIYLPSIVGIPFFF